MPYWTGRTDGVCFTTSLGAQLVGRDNRAARTSRQGCATECLAGRWYTPRPETATGLWCRRSGEAEVGGDELAIDVVESPLVELARGASLREVLLESRRLEFVADEKQRMPARSQVGER